MPISKMVLSDGLAKAAKMKLPPGTWRLFNMTLVSGDDGFGMFDDRGRFVQVPALKNELDSPEPWRPFQLSAIGKPKCLASAGGQHAERVPVVLVLNSRVRQFTLHDSILRGMGAFELFAKAFESVPASKVPILVLDVGAAALRKSTLTALHAPSSSLPSGQNVPRPLQVGSSLTLTWLAMGYNEVSFSAQLAWWNAPRLRDAHLKNGTLLYDRPRCVRAGMVRAKRTFLLSNYRA